MRGGDRKRTRRSVESDVSDRRGGGGETGHLERRHFMLFSLVQIGPIVLGNDDGEQFRLEESYRKFRRAQTGKGKVSDYRGPTGPSTSTGRFLRHGSSPVSYPKLRSEEPRFRTGRGVVPPPVVS